MSHYTLQNFTKNWTQVTVKNVTKICSVAVFDFDSEERRLVLSVDMESAFFILCYLLFGFATGHFIPQQIQLDTYKERERKKEGIRRKERKNNTF